MHWLRPIDGGIWKVLLVSAAMLLPLSGGIIKAITHITLLFSKQIFGQFSPNPFIFFTFQPPMIFWYIGRFHPFPSISAPLLSPREIPPINAKKTQGFLPWVSFIPFFVAELVHFSREENIEIQTNYSCVCIVPYSTQKDKNICSRIIRKAWNRIPGIVALTVSTSVGTSP